MRPLARLVALALRPYLSFLTLVFEELGELEAAGLFDEPAERPLDLQEYRQAS